MGGIIRKDKPKITNQSNVSSKDFQKKSSPLKEAKNSPINAIIKTELEEEDPLEIKIENISDDEEMLDYNEENLIEYQNEFINANDLHHCQICAVGFPQKWKLKAHMKYEHQDYEEKTLYDCSHCKYSATTKNDVLKHINEVHEGEKL